MFELSFSHVKKYMDTNLILEDINFQIYSGEKVGLVGANGSGKSTILKLISGILTLNLYPGSKSLGYDEGIIAMPKDATIAYLDQIPEYPEHYTVRDVLNLAFEHLYEIEREARRIENEMKNQEGITLERLLKRYGDLMNLFEAQGGYEIQEKFSRIAIGLGFGDDFLEKPFHLLSGGEKTTVVLGKILMDRPDILLLDEPTNHLDMDAIEWLESYLKSYEGIVIVVSHDRYFLDNTVSKIIELEDKACLTFKGNYSEYTKQKEEQMMSQFADFKEQQKQIAAMEKAIKELRDWAQRSDNGKFYKRAASIQIKLDKLQRIEKPKFERANMRLGFGTFQRSGNETIKCESLYKAYTDKVLFSGAEMMIKFAERVALVGPNGSGKTTLVRMLLEEEVPDSGIIKFGSSVKYAYLPQKIIFPDEEKTLIEAFRENLDLSEGKTREYLAKFMFYGSAPFKKVRHLSGGERIRLKLARLLFEDVNVLILDEPTNHLDIDSIETFEEALEAFKGTIFFISHDRYFINKISDRVISIEDCKLVSYEGGYSAYKEAKDNRANKADKADKGRPKAEAAPEKVDKNEEKPRIGANPKRIALDLERLEAKIESIESELAQIEMTLNDASQDFVTLDAGYTRKQNLDAELEGALAEWVVLQNLKQEI